MTFSSPHRPQASQTSSRAAMSSETMEVTASLVRWAIPAGNTNDSSINKSVARVCFKHSLRLPTYAFRRFRANMAVSSVPAASQLRASSIARRIAGSVARPLSLITEAMTTSLSMSSNTSSAMPGKRRSRARAYAAMMCNSGLVGGSSTISVPPIGEGRHCNGQASRDKGCAYNLRTTRRHAAIQDEFNALFRNGSSHRPTAHGGR